MHQNFQYMEALIFLTTGFEEIEALATIDILNRGGVDIHSVSITGNNIVTGGHGICVIADYLFEEADFESAIMLIIPGGTLKFNEHDGLKREILNFAEKGKAIAAICAAPMVFGELGLLKGKKATCYPGYEKYLIGADLTKMPVSVDGNITTGRAAGDTFIFALELLSQLKGKETADEVAGKIIIAEQLNV